MLLKRNYGSSLLSLDSAGSLKSNLFVLLFYAFTPRATSLCCFRVEQKCGFQMLPTTAGTAAGHAPFRRATHRHTTASHTPSAGNWLCLRRAGGGSGVKDSSTRRAANAYAAPAQPP